MGAIPPPTSRGEAPMTIRVNRRRLLSTTLAAGAAFPLVAIRTRPAHAAEFSYKYANNSPLTHPLYIRTTEAAARVLEKTGGKVEIKVFPNNQLGSDTDMLSQLRSGALEFFTLSGLILSTLVPVASINGVGFAFKDYSQVWPAMDGALGAYVRAEIGKRGLYAFSKMYDNGYRQITSATKPVKTPEDLSGFKIRVPAVDQHVQGVRRFADHDQLQRGLQRAADSRGRWPGEPAVADRHGQALRSAEVRRHHQPHVGRLLVPGQQEGVRRAAREPARDRRGGVQCLGADRARRPRQDEQHGGRHAEGQGPAVRRDRCRGLPRRAEE